MKLYNDEHEMVGILSGYSDRCITTELENGDKELSFEYPSKGELTGALKEECYIRTEEDEFVLKEVERDTEKCRYTAVLNIEELEGKSFPGGFETVEKTVEECLKAAFEGTGWTVESSVKKRRTIREQDAPSAWDVLKKVLSTYRCECSIDSIGKSVNIEERIGEDRGSYFIEGLNLKKLTPKSDTYDFCTRIYPVGKDGITPESVTGKAYIDNFQYSRKIKAITWKDERYTDVQSLIEDATAKLEEMSKPYIEMQADVADLARCSDRYGILDYNIGDTVTIVSPGTNTKDKQRIVKIVKYPESPEKNTVDIANAKKTFAQVQKEEVDSETERASAEEDSLEEDIAEESSTREEEDGKLNVRLEKTEGSIEAEVSRATGAESGLSSRLTIAEDGISTEATNRKNADSEMSTKISQTAHSISISASGSGNTAGITIALYDENGNLIGDSKTANITITGFVSFTDLASEGTTTINGKNIKTGNISADLISGGLLKGVRAAITDGANAMRVMYNDDYYMMFRAGGISIHHRNPDNIAQWFCSDNSMCIGLLSDANIWDGDRNIATGDLNENSSTSHSRAEIYFKKGSSSSGSDDYIQFRCQNRPHWYRKELGNTVYFDKGEIALKSDIPTDYASSSHNHNFMNLNYSDTGAGNIKGPDYPNGDYNIATTKWVSGHFKKIGSDIRLKTDIFDLQDISDFYMRLKPKKYKFKNGLRGYDNRLHYGFIAQEIESIVTEESNLVYRKQCDRDLSNEDEIIEDEYFYCVDKDEFHAMHVQMIQKQQKQIESLKQENLALQNRLSILEQKMEEIENVINNKNN